MRRIENLVCRIIKKYDVSSPFELCAKMKIKIIKTNGLPAHIQGLYTQFFKKHAIIINQSVNTKRRAFVCAHELGHMFLHQNQNIFDSQVEESEIPRIEKEADYFSAYFLNYVQNKVG